MLVNKITLVDFGIYGGRNEFDLTPSHDRPIVLFGGTNGVGKTTLFKSVPLCLYGHSSMEPRITQKQYHQKIMKSFHRYADTKKSAEAASITLEFQYAHSGRITEYRITRMWENNDGHINETLHVSKKGEKDTDFADLDLVMRSEWQLFVNHLLPRGITGLFFFDGENIQSIAESGGEDKHIKSSFDALLGLDLVNRLHDDIGLYLLRNSDEDTKKILDVIEKKTAEKIDAEAKLENLKEKQVFLSAEINRLRKNAAAQEDEFLKLGGQFAQKRQGLIETKTRLESKMGAVEEKIRTICNDTLPLYLVPDQLEQVRQEIKSDMQKTRTSIKRDMLDEVLEDLVDHLEFTLSSYDEKIKSRIMERMQHAVREKIEALSDGCETMFNLSLGDMNSMVRLIDDVGKGDLQAMKRLAGDRDLMRTELDKVKSMLDITPQQDEIGPMFSEIMQTNREIGEMEKELSTLRDLGAQEKSLIVVINSIIRQNLARQKLDKRKIAGLELAPKVQDALEDFAKKLRHEKVSLLESNILDGMQNLFHKKDFVTNISIDPETFGIALYRNGDEFTRDMMSPGELQVYATAIMWGIARTSGRPLPFIIDTPLARLDTEHRENLVRSFYPNASHQTIIFSTDAEIIEKYYKHLEPSISRSMVIEYDAESGKAVKRNGYFFGSGGYRKIEVR